MKLYKVHGSGNTFYLLDTDKIAEDRWLSLTTWLCDVENEGGADGLLVVLPSLHATAKMRVINADGSEASMCGNGLRCVARYVCEKLHIEEATIETMKATLFVKKEQSLFEELPTYAVEIAPVSFALETLPMHYGEKNSIHHEILPSFSNSISFTAVSVPNPHLIGIVNKHYIEHTAHQQLLAGYLNGENHYCPDGVNVSYVLPLSEHEIFVRTYERGVGFTNACGTAMTASALVSRLNNFAKRDTVTVYNPGGFVQCSVRIENEAYHLRLTGNATFIYQCEIQTSDSGYEWKLFESTGEQQQYERCIQYVQQTVSHFVNL